MKHFLENIPVIIREASRSALGITALVILVVGFLAWSLFESAADLSKLGAFIAVILLFLALLKSVFDFQSRQKNETIVEHKDQQSRAPDEPKFQWSPINDPGASYSLSSQATNVIEVLRGKPDVNWTRQLVTDRAAAKGNAPATVVKKALEELFRNGYLRVTPDNHVEIMPLAVDYYRATVADREHFVPEEEYWEGTL